ncbi:MAG: AbrB/MazE/SpoVT family DNA-binding domain-containing protein [Pseudomonadota bacterium]
METTKLSSKGQVVLPKSVRDARGWREGTEFVIEAVADGVVLRTKKLFPPTSIDQVAGSLAYKGPPKTLEDFDRGIRAEVARRHRRLRLNRAK